MSQVYNVYCDESCHLERDNQKAMVLGAIWCPLDETETISKRIREIKAKHKLKKGFEIKWTKVSPSQKIEFYLDVVDYFFDNNNLHFRCLVVPDKKKLNHEAFKQSHDEWYYKIYFTMLKAILDSDNKYRIYIDIKDTRGKQKIKKLRSILHNSLYDFDRKIIERMQLIQSHESELLQICDLLSGAIGYLNRNLKGNEGKLEIIKKIQQKTNYSLNKSTFIGAKKFNILIWDPTIL